MVRATAHHLLALAYRERRGLRALSINAEGSPCGRGEYLADYGGLFSGKTQALKEATATFEYKFSDAFLMREEWRQDWSNQPYFLTSTLGTLKRSQDTATVGLEWWFGGKEGAW
jgi:hypothetical protein